jgi:hypothetical protein
MSRSHNKKRNVGIIYELLLRNISSALVENNKPSAEIALKIIENRFDKSKELYKEFRLFNALAKTTVSNSAVAAAILTEAKQAARRCNNKKLEKEKSFLIRDINHNLKDKDFYHRRLPEYKIYATIHTLLGEWRKVDSSDLSKMVQYESKIVEWLLTEKEDHQQEDDFTNPDVNKLVVKIMTEKINNKYRGKMNKSQRDLIKSYAFSLSSNNENLIRENLNSLKDKTVDSLNNLKAKTDNGIILEKIDSVTKKIINEDVEKIDDQKISKFLVVMQLHQELKEALNERK